MTHSLKKPDLTGRPAHQPTPDTRHFVTQLASAGFRHCDIAAPLRISETTLRKWYKPELAYGAAHARQTVMATLYQMATSGKHTAATIFLAKTRCGANEDRDSRLDAGRNDYSKLAKYVDAATSEE